MFMKNALLAATLLLLLLSAAANGISVEAARRNLARSLRIRYKILGPYYKLKVSFRKTPALPVCEIGPNGPLNIDSITVFKRANKAVQRHTGLQLMGIDWNPCGHPPAGLWTIPHFDVHFHFNITYDPRTDVTCTPSGIPGVPDFVCLPPPASPDSQKFYEIPTDNIDEGLYPETAVAKMGMHLTRHPEDIPYTQDEWVDPEWIQGSYAGVPTFYELMFPRRTFDERVKWSYMPNYQRQTIDFLPYKLVFRANRYRAYMTAFGVRPGHGNLN